MNKNKTKPLSTCSDKELIARYRQNQLNVASDLNFSKGLMEESKLIAKEGKKRKLNLSKHQISLAEADAEDEWWNG